MVFRRRSNLRPIHRIKHVVDEQGGLTVGTQVAAIIANSVDAPVLANDDQCETGSKINSFFITCEVAAQSAAALSNCYFALYKNPGNNLTPPNINVVGQSDQKNLFIHQEMVMLERADNGNPRTLFKGVILVPRGMRRNAPNDRWLILLLSPGLIVDYCIQVHYKEFR